MQTIVAGEGILGGVYVCEQCVNSPEMILIIVYKPSNIV